MKKWPQADGIGGWPGNAFLYDGCGSRPSQLPAATSRPSTGVSDSATPKPETYAKYRRRTHFESTKIDTKHDAK